MTTRKRLTSNQWEGISIVLFMGMNAFLILTIILTTFFEISVYAILWVNLTIVCFAMGLILSLTHYAHIRVMEALDNVYHGLFNEMARKEIKQEIEK